jgi:hypothetical protein
MQSPMLVRQLIMLLQSRQQRSRNLAWLVIFLTFSRHTYTETTSAQPMNSISNSTSHLATLRQSRQDLKCRTITYSKTSVCPTHVMRQCLSANQPSSVPQTSYDMDMCKISASKACSQIGSSFSSTTGDCKKFACVGSPDTCDTDADCGVAAQEAIQKSLPYCTWWRNQVIMGCSWAENPSAAWETQYENQCIVAKPFSDSPKSMPGLGWHRQQFLKFTKALRAGVPLYDRRVRVVEVEEGFVVFTANVSKFSLSSSWNGDGKDDRLIQGFCITLVISAVVMFVTTCVHIGLLPFLRRSEFFDRTSGALALRKELSEMLERSTAEKQGDQSMALVNTDSASNMGGGSLMSPTVIAQNSIFAQRVNRAGGGWIELVLLVVFIMPLITAAVLGILSCIDALAQLPGHISSVNRILDLAVMYTREFNTTFEALLGEYEPPKSSAARRHGRATLAHADHLEPQEPATHIMSSGVIHELDGHLSLQTRASGTNLLYAAVASVPGRFQDVLKVGV